MAISSFAETAFWQGRTVFLTGHTGFVGGWLALALSVLGARVVGFALPPDGEPNLFSAADVGRDADSIEGDVRDIKALSAAIERAAPEIVFHLAAQPLVRAAHVRPVETFAVNVMGTVHVLEVLRGLPHPRAAIVMTTDKVYRNVEPARPYRESDELGGNEPYSASKAGTELVVDAYRRSYLGGRGIALATLRAGNIMGGGDWAADRLIPDAVRAFSRGETLVLRNPEAVRPWQHVYDVIAGMLLLAQALWKDPRGFATAWNLGPPAEQQCTVEILVRDFCDAWGDGAKYRVEPRHDVPEAAVLRLDSSRARSHLGWATRYNLRKAISETVAWYKVHNEGRDMATYSRASLAGFLAEN